MRKKRLILVSSDYDGTKQIVVLDRDKNIIEFQSISEHHSKNKGNIFLVKVKAVTPSLQATFVDFGKMKNGFLPYSEINHKYYKLPTEIDKDPVDVTFDDIDNELLPDHVVKVQETKNNHLFLDGNTVEDNMLNGVTRSNIIQGINDGVITIEKSKCEGKNHKYKMHEVVKVDMVMVAQVIKDDRGTKGASLTTNVSLPGHLIILLPFKKGVSVSSKITNVSDRDRITAVAEDLTQDNSVGVVLRSVSANASEDKIITEFYRLLELWNSIIDKVMGSEAPALVHKDSDELEKLVRDKCDGDTEIIVDCKTTHQKLIDFVKKHDTETKLVLYSKSEPLLVKYGVLNTILSLQNPKIMLPSGGEIVVESTEAGTFVDVNSSKSNKEKTVESTALTTNLEAAEEVCTQVRLRNTGGLIVVDFIDMKNPDNNRTVENKVKEVLKIDLAKTQFSNINSFGVLTLSRQLKSHFSHDDNTITCSSCQGTGFKLHPQFASWLILQKLREHVNKLLSKNNSQSMLNNDVRNIVSITVPQDVGLYLLNNKRKNIDILENYGDVKIEINFNDKLTYPGCYEIIDVKNSSAEIENSDDSRKSQSMEVKNEISDDSCESFKNKDQNTKIPKKRVFRKRKRKTNAEGVTVQKGKDLEDSENVVDIDG